MNGLHPFEAKLRALTLLDKIEDDVEKMTKGRKNLELAYLRQELGALGGVGHYFENDQEHCFGGVRDWMQKNGLLLVLRALALGQKKINLKESFLIKLFYVTRILKKLKKVA